MRFERYYIYLILTLALTLNWIVDGSSSFGKTDLNLGLLPKKSIIVIELLQVLLLARLILRHFKQRIIQISLLLLSVIVGFEFVIHVILGNNITIFISGVRYYFSFFPLFLLGYIFGARKLTIKKEMRWLLILILIQIPVSIFQFFEAQVKLAGSGLLFFDAISGTMGGFAPNLMSAVCCIGIFYFLIDYLDNKKVLSLVLAILLLIPPIISESKGIFLLLVVSGFFLIKSYKLNLVRYFLFFLGVALVGMISTSLYSFLDFGSAQNIDPEFLLEYIQKESGSGRLSRLDSIFYAFQQIFEEQSPLFGMGIGSANGNPIGANPKFNDFFTIRHSVDILITETGIIGLSALILFIIYTARKITLLIKNPLVGSYELRLLRLGGILIVILTIGIFWVDILYRVQFMYPFGLIIGYIFGLKKYYK